MILFNTMIPLKELVANSDICHEDVTGKRGENVVRVNISTVGMSTFLLHIEFLHFGGKISSLLHF